MKTLISIEYEELKTLTNCKNCGAPLHGGRCEYCGTEYPSAQLSDTDISDVINNSRQSRLFENCITLKSVPQFTTSDYRDLIDRGLALEVPETYYI